MTEPSPRIREEAKALRTGSFCGACSLQPNNVLARFTLAVFYSSYVTRLINKL